MYCYSNKELNKLIKNELINQEIEKKNINRGMQT